MFSTTDWQEVLAENSNHLNDVKYKKIKEPKKKSSREEFVNALREYYDVDRTRKLERKKATHVHNQQERSEIVKQLKKENSKYDWVDDFSSEIKETKKIPFDTAEREKVGYKLVKKEISGRPVHYWVKKKNQDQVSL